MSDPFIGEIKIFTGSFAPRGYAFCQGQEMSIRSNTALYSLLGNTYGGNGVTTFCLPDLRGRAPMGAGAGPALTPRQVSDKGGSTDVELKQSELPAHAHGSAGSGDLAVAAVSAGNTWANTGRSGPFAYSDRTAAVAMHSLALQPAGGIQSHKNVQPCMGVNFIIALEGEFPVRG